MNPSVIIPVVKSFYLLLKYRLKFSKVDYFNYEELVRMPDLRLPTPFFFNISYGLYRSVEKLYYGKVDLFHDYIEHGLFYSETATLLKHILKEKKIKRVFTFSNRRKEQIERILRKEGYRIEVVAIGPMIPAANNFYPHNKLLEIKKKLGETLLVIPMHSWSGVNNNFSSDVFIEEVERIKHNFNTVLVCLYYMDIRKGKHQYYIDKGYTVVCNGDRLDPNFISRHKDLIELADMTMSNGIGTHIGYSIALNKPHYYYKQEMVTELSATVKVDEEVEQAYRIELEKQIVSLFGTFDYQISEEQKNFVRLYWGNY